ncbi:hypothetical protein [Cardiobacterium valvarum]|uniref:Uncharacterized protein n=1 Tax=Cardiobacterium valvarum F0432 TaxID=797473 RepID=G9ZIN9_9GAMM|nr:hypothetical protein [Cardiobacterium valvarum]EHM51677.1 hypothetical protein HMPREF9080_02650 [Cardiobacterium valvarum F0432]
MIVIGHFSTLRGAGHKLYTGLSAATTALRELWQSTPWRLGWRAAAIGIIGYWDLRAGTLTEPLLQVMANTLTVLTGLLLSGSVLVTLLRMLLSFGVRKQPSAAARSFDCTVARSGLYWILDIILFLFSAIVLLQAVGPVVLQAAREYPEKMAAAGLASGIFILLVLSAVMMLLFRRQDALRIRLEEMVPEDDPVAARLKQLKTELRATHTAPRPFEQRQIAAYLAGQVLCCAALARVPARIDTRLYRPGDWDFLDAMAVGMNLRRLREIEDWLLLCLLAGGAADIRLRDSLSRPLVRQVADDNARWQVAVRDYLAFYYRQTYFANPRNAVEAMWAEQIDTIVDILHGQQMGIVTRFLTANEAVLRELATVIRSKSVLSRDDLQPFFARVTFPDHFPRPGGVV